MLRIHRVLPGGLLFCLLSCGGCSQFNGYDWRNSEWAKSPRLDRIQVVVVDARGAEGETGNTQVIPPKADIEKWTRDALRKVPGAIVVNDTPDADKAVVAGGATMLCRVTIGEAGKSFAIGVPVLSPLWSNQVSVGYDIELIDIPSGEVRFKAVRFIAFGGGYDLLPLPDVSTLYQRDIAHVLHFATVPASPSPPPTAAAAHANAPPIFTGNNPAILF